MISDKVSSLVVSKSRPPVPASLRDSYYPNPNYFPQIIDSIVYSPAEGAISKILSEMDHVPESPSGSISVLKLLSSQLSFIGVRRAIGLLRDEAYWKLGRINLHPQSRSIPGGLGKKEINRVLRAMKYQGSIVASRKTLNLWEFRARK